MKGHQEENMKTYFKEKHLALLNSFTFRRSFTFADIVLSDAGQFGIHSTTCIRNITKACLRN